MASINGIAHIQLTVTSMERSVPFYRKLLQSFEMVTCATHRTISISLVAARESPSRP